MSWNLRASGNHRKKKRTVLESETVPCRDGEKWKIKIKKKNLAYGKRRLCDPNINI